jgi:hypothetical protein
LHHANSRGGVEDVRRSYPMTNRSLWKYILHQNMKC